MKQINILEASVYVGTYGKYNAGSLYGNWLNLSDYADKNEFFEVCKEMHSDELDPEYMFQDYENIPESLIDEAWLSDNIFDVLKAFETLDEKLHEPFLIWSNNSNYNLSLEDIQDLINEFKNDYVGEYSSEEDFAREFIEDTYNLPDFAKQYFDYEAFAKDLFAGDYWSGEGYIFHA